MRLPGAPPSKCAPDLLPPVSSPWGSRRRRAGWGRDSPPRLQNPEPPHALHGIHGSTQNYKWLNQTWTSLFTSMDEISNEILSNTLDISTWQFHRLSKSHTSLGKRAQATAGLGQEAEAVPACTGPGEPRGPGRGCLAPTFTGTCSGGGGPARGGPRPSACFELHPDQAAHPMYPQGPPHPPRMEKGPETAFLPRCLRPQVSPADTAPNG